MTRGSLLARGPSGMRSALDWTVRGVWSARFRCLPHTVCRSRVQTSWPARAPCSHLPSQQTGNSSSSTSSCLLQRRMLSITHTTAVSVRQQGTHIRLARTYAHTHAHIHTHACEHIQTQTRANTHRRAHARTHAQTHTHTCMCMHTLRT